MLLSAVGVFRTILILIAVIVILRFVGRVMISKRNINHENEFQTQKQNFQKEKQRSKENYGKVSITKNSNQAAEDTEFVEIDESKLNRK